MPLSRIRTRILLLTAIPLAFLVAVLLLALVLQTRNALVARQSQRVAQLVTDTDRAVQLVGQADRSLAAYQKDHKEASLAPFDQALKLIPQTLADISNAVGSESAQRPRAALVARYFGQGMTLLRQVRSDLRLRNDDAVKKLVASPSVRRLNTNIMASIAALTLAERTAAAARLLHLNRQIEAFTVALVALCFLGILVTIGASVRFGGGVTRRIDRLAENARRLASGERVESIEGNDEISQLDGVYREMTMRVAREHDRAAELQRALLPQALPEFPGVRLDAAYLPAAQSVGVGGDWYDVFRISEHVIGISIGDVAGHGLAAAALMGNARQAIRTLAYIDDDPSVVMRYVNRALCRNEEGLMVTALFATFDMLDGSLRYCFAGHPAPMIVRTGGAVEALPGEGIALGLDAAAEFETLHCTLEIGSALVLYTDGVVEAERDYFSDLVHLREAIEEEYRDASRNIAEAIARRVFARCLPSDDVALLFVGVTALGSSAVRAGRRVWNVDAREEKSARRVKRALLWHLGEISVGTNDLAASEVVVSELLGNVARHTPGPAQVRLEWRDGTATVSVFDRGLPFALPAEDAAVEVFAESGRGLILLRALARRISIARTDEGNRVDAVLPVTVQTGDELSLLNAAP
jgi:serine phosphatase RsbU (regulator of sigma subunit)/anti-sigma regulatory factor (Ser/Thr protein kinase)/CHASE3 domain sensor protein